MSPAAGMGDAFKDWVSPREKAEQEFFEPETPPEEPDQGKKVASKAASKSASKAASVSGNEDRGETHDVSTPLAETPQAPPPPPTRRSPGRVQFNHRIRADRDRLLQKYKNKHETSMQAIVDQMVDEYLSARGLLPQDSE